MKNIIAKAVYLLLVPALLCAEDPSSCKRVRMADIGWTDVTATTAVAAEILRRLGYEPEVTVLSVPVTLAGLKNNDIDVFLGNWMPTQEADIRPYLNEGSVEQLRPNLEGAVFTLAVPDYVYERGVKTFGDLTRFKDLFKREIYGLEPGNDGNRLILKMINDNAFDLRDWRLVESSEQAMLVQVKDAISRRESVVFLGWAPHPMNMSIKLKYLAGGDQYFGPNLGASRVYTVTRRGFLEACPNLKKLFSQLLFSVDIENRVMSLILNDQLAPELAAKQWLEQHPNIVKKWLVGVTTVSGDNGALRAKVSPALTHLSTKAPLGHWMEKALTLITSNFADHFRAFSDFVEAVVKSTENILLWPHWGVIIAIFSFIVFVIHKSVKLTLAVVAGLLLIVNLGLWVETIKTLVLVTYSSSFAVIIGVPVGVMAARRPWFYACLRPVLDLMQTIPTFVYLIPSLMLFGLGLVPGLISTIIFAVAAPIRLTYLGITSVPKDLIEASVAFGATKMQTLAKVELPYAMPSLMTGLSQCVMLSLSMVVIAALVGADGLGTPVVRALNTVNIELGFEAGAAIVILAILLDRSLSLRNSL